MAINTQAELIEDLREVMGESSTSLPDARAIRNLNYGFNNYSSVAMGSDHNNQMGDTQWKESSVKKVPIATATLSQNKDSVTLKEEFLGINFLELEAADGSKSTPTVSDRKLIGTTPNLTDIGRPTEYDYFAHVFYFDRYADQDYTLRVFYTRAFEHLVEGDPNQIIGIPWIHSEYIVLYAAHRLGFRTSDTNLVPIERRLEKFESQIETYWSDQTNKTEIQKLDINLQIKK